MGGVLGLEGGYYRSEDDPRGENSVIENSRIKGLVGYSHSLWKDAALGLQGFVEWMEDYDPYIKSLPAGYPERDELRWIATARFTQLLFHQTLTLNLFGFLGITEEDGYLIPSIHYAVTDALWAEIGGNIFFGEVDTTFGAFDKNDNVYLTVRYGF